MTFEAQTLATTSAFEVLGPIMVGPSSSHTAGALRVAHVAAHLVDDSIHRVRFILWNSFSHTYQGHGTDRALVAGILGFTTDDERIRDAFTFADEAGLAYSFLQAGDDDSIHPNTVDIELDTVRGKTISVRGESLGGAKIRISRINGVGVEISGIYATLFITHQDAPGALASITHALATAEVNIAFCRTYRAEASGYAYTVVETDGTISDDMLKSIQALPLVETASFIKLPGSAQSLVPGLSTRDLFDDGAQMLAVCKERGINVGQLMQLREEMLTSADVARTSMKRVIDVMRRETEDPRKDPRPSLGGYLGGEAQLIMQHAEALASPLMGTVQSDAISRAMAVLERSASMGVIVAAPTAGSAGVVPGAVLALAEHLHIDEEQLAEALYCAAGVGLILSANACVAGAEGGCQAEVGSAAAMAAAALVQLMGGSPEQALDAASISIQNLLGLICDPVHGLVEVPCQNRNAIGVAAAFSSAQLVLSGIKSVAPFDETAHVMLQVGHALPSSLRETAQGGLALAPSAQRACTSCMGCR
ncbi:L-serine ammonia-lyase, iron-sulfur-dependent, subunit alpha [Collinsella sp. zg1085]|uniref:L-serine ammonia-lyase, iron-sulfur-dependent, subunit alpha n=1 Tax=Collinsella sp. zg1085 TaxID=2844380 RepID=UPI001C0C10C1|nr:L-serine ammonia-lyase, iron-sulfur-dependent, subunit alpha [Collinsella sp. zg1085]QWT17152.1 L-serine ammonia-lyase, iron-sulfur-dependent, subunit alpha [Collinsella sp. zg1085]